MILSSKMKKYSYCGYNCLFVNADIGAFCSISDNVIVGGGNHPITWVSTSPAFYTSRDRLPKRFSKLEYDYNDAHTIIENDVWIGNGVHIKPGIRIGNGAVVGMGSVVTKDVEPYTIVAGNPARVIRRRFDDDTIEKLMESKWWEWNDEKLEKYSEWFDDTEKFISRLKE